MINKIILAALLILIVPIPASAGWMNCTGGNVYEGDDMTQVILRCGPPLQASRTDPILITEQVGNQLIQRLSYRRILFYPGGSNGRLYRLEFENNRLISIN